MPWCVIEKTGDAWPLPCGSHWLARQLSPRVSFLYPSLYIDIPIVLLQTHRYAGIIECRAAFILARTDQRLAGGRSMNIVQRLGHRALTGRGLGIIMHQHYGYRVHFELRCEFGSRSFERRFRGYQSCNRFCISVIRGYTEGLCECMLVREGISFYAS